MMKDRTWINFNSTQSNTISSENKCYGSSTRFSKQDFAFVFTALIQVHFHLATTESPKECYKESDFKIRIFKFLWKVFYTTETWRPGKRERMNEDTERNPEGVKADHGGHLQHHVCTQMILQFILCVAVLQVFILIYVWADQNWSAVCFL